MIFDVILKQMFFSLKISKIVQIFCAHVCDSLCVFYWKKFHEPKKGLEITDFIFQLMKLKLRLEKGVAHVLLARKWKSQN
jgi:hypothetical protein